MKKKNIINLLLLYFIFSGHADGQSLYFPPLSGNTWDTVSLSSLGWCQPATDTLLNFLDQKHTKAFIILKNGKIAVENYFGTFTTDSIWYWASAGKSLAGFLTGIAQEEGLLAITDSTSKFLGTGWTSCSPVDEGLITIKNQLSMTTGLNDSNSTSYCYADSCLYCLATPGTRWAYHNAPYTLLHAVIANASGVSFNNFTQSHVLSKTGMSGLWFSLGFDDIFFSKARTMARFGLLILNKGNWNGDTLLHDTTYFYDMMNASQSLNLSYGYLWWLNGKSSYMLPGSQFVFPGPLIPSAPADMVAALGKNDQKIYVIPSGKMVIIRMGNAADTSLGAQTSFDEMLWQKLNDVFCSSSSIPENGITEPALVFPNPFTEVIHLRAFDAMQISHIEMYNTLGEKIISAPYSLELNPGKLKSGFYFLRLISNKTGKIYYVKVAKSDK